MRLADIRAAVERHEKVVLVMIASASGSTPREAGAAMLVSGEGAIGTIGGGAVEHEALAVAREMLLAPGFRRTDMALGPEMDQCCGGRLSLAFRTLTGSDLPLLTGWEYPLSPEGPVFHDPPARRQVLVYGAGHVGRALIIALGPLGFRLSWVDARLEAFPPESFPGVEQIETPLPEAVARDADADALHVVMTHSHALDLEIVASVLRRGRFGFLGLIGSATKRAVFERRLRDQEIDAPSIARLTCPIGLPGITGKCPEVIAAATAAQLLQVSAEGGVDMPMGAG